MFDVMLSHNESSNQSIKKSDFSVDLLRTYGGAHSNYTHQHFYEKFIACMVYLSNVIATYILLISKGLHGVTVRSLKYVLLISVVLKGSQVSPKITCSFIICSGLLC